MWIPYYVCVLYNFKHFITQLGLLIIVGILSVPNFPGIVGGTRSIISQRFQERNLNLDKFIKFIFLHIQINTNHAELVFNKDV